MTSSRASSLGDAEKNPEVGVKPADSQEDIDAEFGGCEARRKLERRLLRKLDLRMSILVVIYILNYVSRLILINVCTLDYSSMRTDRPQQCWVRLYLNACLA